MRQWYDCTSPVRRPQYWVRDVWSGDRFRKPVLRTYDVHAAVRELERPTADVRKFSATQQLTPGTAGELTRCLDRTGPGHG
ncbi:hypothetical protein AB0M86_32720 [Streptomyces sp. NPDC051639]|uniref:hypothetical protein n=1 Tax=unclassified Streptomyces TaxID=2593676 RepID=UPI002E332978|nr:hypothetical protein [Streptomyces sp. NBC_01455]